MDKLQQTTIEEELEQEDETLRSHARDEEDEESPNPVDVEAKPAEVQSEEDEMGLGVRRRTSCQRSRSSGESSNSCPPLWVRHSHREKLPTRSPRTSGEGKQERARTYQKATRGTSRKKATSKHAPFPKWLVDLMWNIEEATTHELVVE